MTVFQIAALGLLGCFFAITVANAACRRTPPSIAIFWSLLWIGGATAVIRPELTAAIARFLGISRGADLVFYVSILAMLFGFFAVYMRLLRIEDALTRIVRELALRSPSEPLGPQRDEKSSVLTDAAGTELL